MSANDNAWTAERFEEMLRALLRGEVDIEEVCDDLDRIHTFAEAGVLTKDCGLVVTMSDGKRIHLTIQ
jgi:hypothetical protein